MRAIEDDLDVECAEYEDIQEREVVASFGLFRRNHVHSVHRQYSLLYFLFASNHPQPNTYRPTDTPQKSE
jgi:hypothetical protein